MQQFVVPQFIDNEDKIIGPITVRQFLIILAAVIICAVAYKILDFAGFVLAVLFVGGSAAVLAFVKINGRAFHYFILNLLQVVLRPAIRVWQPAARALVKKEVKPATDQTNIPQLIKPKEVSANRLSELSLLVDTGGQYQPEEEIFNK